MQHRDRIIIPHNSGIAADESPEQVSRENVTQDAFSTRVVVTGHSAMDCPLAFTRPYQIGMAK
jgi:ABC-type hemin transport system ATPase subunit